MKDGSNYSGADIDSIVREAMKRVFVRNINSGRPESQWEQLSQAVIEELIEETPSSYHSQRTKLDRMLKILEELDVKPAS